MAAATLDRPVSLAGLPLAAWAFAVRTWLAVVLALYVSFWLELETATSAALTVAILSLPTRGQGLEKAGFRLLATLLGVAATFVITGVFAQTGLPLLLAFSVWIGLCVYAAGRLDGNRAYAAALGAVTVAFIAVQNLDTPQNVFEAATARGAAIVVGILAVAFVNDLLAAPDYHPLIAARLGDLARRASTYATAVRRGEPTAAADAARLLHDITALRPEVTGLAAESSDGHARALAARVAMVMLVELVAAARALGRLAALAPGGGLAGATARFHAAARLAAAERELRDDLAALRDARPPPRALKAPNYRSHALALENAIAGGVSFAVAALALTAAGWPAAQTSLAFVGILIGLTATAPDRRAFAKLALLACVAGCLLAGILEFIVLDGVTGFPLLALGLAPFVIGLGLLMTLRNPLVATLARTTLIVMIAVFGPSNPQTYDPQTFLFACLFVSLAALLLFLVQYLVPGRTAAQRLDQLLAEARRDIGRCGDPDQSGYAPEEHQFRGAVRVGQVVDLAAASGEGNRAVAWAVRRFDEAGAARRCAAALRGAADGPSADIVAAARAALRRGDGAALLTLARRLEASAGGADPPARSLAASLLDASLALPGGGRTAASPEATR